MSKTVWFNKGFSSLYNIISLIKEADSGEDFRILCTHENPEFVGFEAADAHEVEDRFIGDVEYVQYCLDVCRRHDVSIFLPSKKMTVIARHRQAFRDQGIQVMVCAGPETLDILNDKAAFYGALSCSGLAVPEYYAVSDLLGFDEACHALRQGGRRICFKPTRSIYGLGFKVVRDSPKDIDAFLSGDVTSVSLEEARRKLGGTVSFQPLMVMEFLEGSEYSVDCLAKDGRLVRGTVRRKSSRVGGAQCIERNDQVLEMAEVLASRFGLSGLFNVQARCAGSVPMLLEINPRMAGGIYFSCLAGVNYPYWAIRLALDDCEESIPRQRFGFRVNQVYRPLELFEAERGGQ